MSNYKPFKLTRDPRARIGARWVVFDPFENRTTYHRSEREARERIRMLLRKKEPAAAPNVSPHGNSN